MARATLRGLKGKDILLGARIIAVADALSGMIDERPYRKPLTFEEACLEVLRNAGSQFDPMVVGAFLRIEPKNRTWFGLIS